MHVIRMDEGRKMFRQKRFYFSLDYFDKKERKK